ncbi:beta-chimaerin [Ctenocephalides felis]|uniref:beta-chimaerin n=1 Tax=Ctenocephalides felis TaxID=7515 RepID=UPI000E6E5003|nr:beta-chimaerin [Ctenocephalides felis]
MSTTSLDLTSDKPLIWKPELYQLQLSAPIPNALFRTNDLELGAPNFYGYEYHGIMGHQEANKLLHDSVDGTYLIRRGSNCNDFYTLTVVFEGRIHNYKLYYQNGMHFIRKDVPYESIHDLVADGLIAMHMEIHARHVIPTMHECLSYKESPYMTLNKRKLKLLKEKTNILDVKADEVCKSQASKDKINEPVSYCKPHSFKVHTFKGLNWCELCANFLWGFIVQGVKCEDCGFVAHSKCSEHVPNDCSPDLKSIRGVFGTDLTTLLNARSEALPFIVLKCAEEIEKRGLDQEGIYRVSGFQDEIDMLKCALDTGGEVIDISKYNVNVVAGTLKLYLRLLPVPLITFSAHPDLIKATEIKDSHECVSVILAALNKLPVAHFNTLKYMIRHLYRVTTKSDINKMTAHNLSTVFAPTLIAITNQVTNLTQEILILELMITFCNDIFKSN